MPAGVRIPRCFCKKPPSHRARARPARAASARSRARDAERCYPDDSLLRVHDEPEWELRAARAERGDERVEQVQDDTAPSAGIDDLPDDLQPVAVVNHFHVAKISEQMF